METSSRLSYLNFSKPYMQILIVITAKINMPFIESIENFRNKSIEVIKDNAIVEKFSEKYLFLNIVEIKNTNEGLEKTSKGENFAFVDSLQNIVYKLQSNQTENLKTLGKLNENWELGMAV